MPELDLKEDRKQQVEQLGESEEEQEEEGGLDRKRHSICIRTMLERIYKPHNDNQKFSPLSNETDLDRQ